jgi:hypothetical protein
MIKNLLLDHCKLKIKQHDGSQAAANNMPDLAVLNMHLITVDYKDGRQGLKLAKSIKLQIRKS